MRIQISRMNSPLGALAMAITGSGDLCALEFEGQRSSDLRDRLKRSYPEAAVQDGTVGGEIVERLRAYFGGDLHALDDIRSVARGTPFQEAVWRQLREIQVGRMVSYGDVARAIGRPKAVRAVGAANGQNPIALVVPCHRVVASNGALHGYGGGLDRKAWLLRHEKALPEMEARRGIRGPQASVHDHPVHSGE